MLRPPGGDLAWAGAGPVRDGHGVHDPAKMSADDQTEDLNFGSYGWQVGKKDDKGHCGTGGGFTKASEEQIVQDCPPW